MSKAKDREGLKKEFYDLYSDTMRTAGLSEAKRKRLEKFRNEMAVDFYNLKIDSNTNYVGMTIEQVFELYKDQINIFRDKYILYKGIEKLSMNITETITWKMEIDPSDQFMCKLIIEHKDFKNIVDKAIERKEMTEGELSHIAKNFFGEINQYPSREGGKIILYTMKIKNDILFRALYEWVMLVSQKLTDVKRCEAPKCDKLFLPEPRGKEQKYCSETCKMRAFRTNKLSATIAIKTEMTCKLTKNN